MRVDLNIHDLVIEGKLSEIQAITQKSPSSVNALNDFKESPLVVALKHKKNAILDHFLELPGIDFHQQSYSYGTALLAAVYFNNLSAVKKLIQKEREANQGLFKPEKHPALLVCAIKGNSKEMVELLLREGVNVNESGRTFYQEPPYGFDNDDEPTPFDPYGTPVFELPIIAALQNKKLNVIPTLLSYNPDMEKKGTMGMSAQELIASGRLHKEVQDLVTPRKHSTTLFSAVPADIAHFSIPVSLSSAYPNDLTAQGENCIRQFQTDDNTVNVLHTMMQIQRELLSHSRDLPKKERDLLEKMFRIMAEKIVNLENKELLKEEVSTQCLATAPLPNISNI